MAKIRVNSRELLKAIIDANMSIKAAAEELKIRYKNMQWYIKKDKVIRTTTANKLIKYFGEQVVYIDEGRAESGTESARSPTAEGEQTAADKGEFVVDSSVARRIAAGAKTYTEDRNLDDLSY